MKMSTGLFAAFLAIFVGLAGWYQLDRTSLLQTACEVGLPNFSRPADITQADLGCAILGREGIYSGVLTIGPEASNFSSSDFVTGVEHPERANDRSWFHCPKNGCEKDLDSQLSRTYECELSGFATITVEGRATVSKGRFGHLGAFSREFYATRILKVSPAPNAMIQDLATALGERGLCH